LSSLLPPLFTSSTAASLCSCTFKREVAVVDDAIEAKQKHKLHERLKAIKVCLVPARLRCKNFLLYLVRMRKYRPDGPLSLLAVAQLVLVDSEEPLPKNEILAPRPRH